MRHLALAAVVCICLGMGASAQAQAQATDPQVVAPINKFMDAFNKGDMAAAAATHAADADLAIADEVPPFQWRGAQAFKSWADDLTADAKKNGLTDQHVSVGKPTRVEIDGTSAYVVVPSVYSFKKGGVAMQEKAQMTFILKKGASGWLIHGWTWTGPRAQKAAAPAGK
jgi:ketosteroid isomerase-like protein